MLGSAHNAQLHESLLATSKELQKSKEENDCISRAKLKLEAEVYDYRNKLTEVVNSSMTMENSRCDLQLQVSGCVVAMVTSVAMIYCPFYN